MATETTTQIIREDPAIEAYRLGLLESVRQFIDQNLASAPPPPVLPPSYQVAGLTDLQQEASMLAQEGVGAYLPYLQHGTALRQSGQSYLEDYGFGGLSEALGATREGQEMLSQAAGRANEYRNRPYTYQTGARDLLQGAMGTGQQALGAGRTDIENALTRGMGGAQTAQSMLSGTGAQFQPTQIQAFMSPYEDEVVQQTLADIRREGDIREQGLQAQAAATGAFGGSRQAVAEQELARNVADQQAKVAGQLRMGGYTQAGQQAQEAFERAKQREQAAASQFGQLGLQGGQLGLQGAQTGAQLGMQQAGMEADIGQAMGGLGMQYGQLEQANLQQMMDMAQASGQLGQQLGGLANIGGALGQQMSQMGVQEAGIGQLVQQMLGQDVKGLEAFGARDQALQQAILDAQRMSNMQLYQQPYQQYSFLSDIYKGVPGSQQSVSVSSTQDPSPFQQVAGLGIAGLSALGGAKSAFGF